MSNQFPLWAIVPASGIGRRMLGDRPKQYLSFCHKTIIEHTLDRLFSCDKVCGVIIVLRKDDEYWEKLQYKAQKPLLTAAGGTERQDSVINGLIKLCEVQKGSCYAMVHDAVRPLVKTEDLNNLIDEVEVNQVGAILASPITDTLKRVNQPGLITESIDRNGLWRAFTPQIFKLDLLLEALQKAKQNNQILTDDAAAMEASGYRPKVVECSPENIKITRPEDLKLAEHIWLSQQT